MITNLTRIILDNYEGYLVGSAAEKLYEESRGVLIALLVKDFDIIIPPIQWNDFMRIVPNYEFVKFKRLGGIQLIDKGFKHDIWSMDLGTFYQTLPENYSGYAMNSLGEFIKRL